jgi:hypothetical protein
MRTAGLRLTFLASFGLSILVGAQSSENKSAQPQCANVSISFSLETDDSFQQRISDLAFKVQPLSSTGWMFSLEDAKGRDFIYPVNPALRFNGSQMLGAGYGDTAKQSLSHSRDLHFLLNESDYEAFWPYVDHALWPYTAPDSNQAAEQYLSQLDKLRTGLLRLTIVRSDVSESDEVRSAELKVEFIAPATYPFLSSLSPHTVACQTEMLPINERIPARISTADPSKYRNVQDAANWKNPYLVITSEGFDLRVRGGQMHGPLAVLARTIVGLPDSAWPYGRVLAASESGVRSRDSCELIKKNKEQADKILKDLGVIVDWWASA